MPQCNRFLVVRFACGKGAEALVHISTDRVVLRGCSSAAFLCASFQRLLGLFSLSYAGRLVELTSNRAQVTSCP